MNEPCRAEGPAPSLIERAALGAGAGLLRTAPVPARLVGPGGRIAPANPAPAKTAPARATPPTAASPADALQAGAPQASGPPASALAPDPEERRQDRPKQRLVFAGPVHQIDRRALAFHGLIEPPSMSAAADCALMEEFRIIRRRVVEGVRSARRAGLGEMAQRILITSPLPDEGKTFCAANLALALAAEKDLEVLLVDADFARPSLPRVLGLPAGPGLLDALADPAIRLEACVVATDIGSLHFLPAGRQTGSDSEYLTSQSSAALLDDLTRGAPQRVVVFDSPPALAASPAAELAGQVGQTILVARADRTGQSALEDALTLLARCPDLKLLLNGAHFSPSGRRFGGYYRQEEMAL